MTETRTSDSADAEWTHPIPKDIVIAVADEHEIDAKLLHTLLEEGSSVWDGHREDLEKTFYALHFGPTGFRTFTVEGFLIAWGPDYHPKYLLRDVYLSDHVTEYHGKVSQVRLVMAVTQAHRRFAERLQGHEKDDWYPVVIPQPSEQ